MHQMFAVKVCEKYLANEKGVFGAFVNLEYFYDPIDRHAVRQMLRVSVVCEEIVESNAGILRMILEHVYG